MSRTTVLTRAALPMAVMALTLAACGPGDSNDEGQDPASPDASDLSTSGIDRKAGDIDAALPMGRVSHQTFQDERLSVKVAVKPLRVRRGTIADLSQYSLKGKEGKVPYYVDMRYTNEGGDLVSGSPRVNSNLSAMVDHKTEATKLSLLGSLPKCRGEGAGVGESAKPSPRDWAVGDSMEECAAFLLPENQKIAYIKWSPDPTDMHAVPVLWKAG